MSDAKKELEETSPFSRRLATRWLGRRVVFFRETPSTQDEARRLFPQAPHGLVVWADRQAAGRGRLGRAWFSPRGAGLYCSFVLREPLARPLPAYGLVTALGVAEALEEAVQVPFRLKWPNDVLLGGRKVAGILLEAQPGGLIVGLGVNVATRRDQFPPEMRDKATSIFEETGLAVSRARVLRRILERLEPLYEKLGREGFGAFRASWAERDVAYGARVVLRRAERVITGVALGPDQDGTLILKTAAGRERVHSGEILLWEIPGWESRAA